MANTIRNTLVIDKKYKDLLVKEGKVDFSILKEMPEALNVDSSGHNDMYIYTYLSNKLQKSSEEVSQIEVALNTMEYYDHINESVDNYIKSIPEKYKNTKISVDEAYEKGKVLVENYEKYGATTWDSWRKQHWGCKWNALTLEVSETFGKLCLIFDTPNTPPRKWFELLTEKGVDFEAYSSTGYDSDWKFVSKDGELNMEEIEIDYDDYEA